MKACLACLMLHGEDDPCLMNGVPIILAKPNVCQHRGPSAGKASCGCGAVYRCNLLDKYCADNPLAFPLYEINVVNEDGSMGHLLSKNYQSDSRAVSENFQACSECDFNSNKLKAVADLDSASKN